jgi:cardiolipin synthase A/B
MKSIKSTSLIFIIITSILYLLIINNCNASHVIINEVMFNPVQEDNYFEWIECYNPTDKPVNMSSWNITDNHGTDTLEPDVLHGNGSMILPPNRFCLITDQGTKLFDNQTLSNNTLFLSVDDAAIGNGLGNSADKIILTDKNETVIDAIEWGQDFEDIPGNPINDFSEGFSIIRISTYDTNDTYTDFTSTQTLSPGTMNMASLKGSITIQTCPQYIAKTFAEDSYSISFSILAQMQNFTPNEIYELKVSVQDLLSTNKITSQTWEGTSWQYSDRYLFTIHTNETGSWSKWIHLRLNKQYIAYHNQIINNETALLQINVRKNEEMYETSQEVILLDMDDDSSNGIKGGYFTYILSEDEAIEHENKIFLLKDKNDTICGMNPISFNENNIENASNPSFVKIAAAIGNNYSLFTVDTNQQYTLLKNNISVQQGKNKVAIEGETSHIINAASPYTFSFILTNSGQFNDTYFIEISSLTRRWHAKIGIKNINIAAGEQTQIIGTITPCNIIEYVCPEGELSLLIQSSTDPEAYVVHHLHFEVNAPDLMIPKIITYDPNGIEKNTILQGQNMRIKAYYKNYGNKNASNTKVLFYCDKINETNIIGIKEYGDVGKYQKYPSILWDTSHIKPGKHMIYVIADGAHKVQELNEFNNDNQIEINIINTSPTNNEKQLMISEFYYDNHPGISNEYICLYNPTNTSIRISNWYITTKADKKQIDQCKITFPNNANVSSKSKIYITQNASAFYRETGFYPDFEYHDDSLCTIPQMEKIKTVTLSDVGSIITLKNHYNHTIDVVAYGNVTLNNNSHWNGHPIPIGNNGQVHKRKSQEKSFIDTDTKEDFNTTRYFYIGQSEFAPPTFSGTFNMTFFVSPDNSYNALTSVIQHAKKTILLNMYEFTNYFLCNELIACLRKNISVSILLEGNPVGGINDQQWIILNRLDAAGANIRFITQNASGSIYNRYPFNHAKYLIIDNEISIIESCNFATYGIPVNPSYGNREWGIVIYNKTIASYFQTVYTTDCNDSRPDIISYKNMTPSITNEYYMNYEQFHGTYDGYIQEKNMSIPAEITPIFSPDTSLLILQDLIEKANTSIYIEQLYIYPTWKDGQNPLIAHLIKKAKQGIDIKVILNYNPVFKDTNKKCNITKQMLEEHGIEVKYIYTNESSFTNIHNKGMIIDNETVLISSINWNENSIMKNREAGVVVQSKEAADYFLEVFLYDWSLEKHSNTPISNHEIFSEKSDNTIYIVSLFTCTFIIIAHDWRKRKWA